jgi:parvulin-like peptidyl-prolyl isomerase
MIKGEVYNKINDKVERIIEVIPHTLNQEQKKIVVMITQEILLELIDEIGTAESDNKAQKDLIAIKNTWHKLNNLLK